MERIKTFERFINESKIPASFRDEEEMKDYLVQSGGYVYIGDGSGMSTINLSNWENSDWPEPWSTFRTMLKTWASDGDFRHNWLDSSQKRAEYDKLVNSWIASETKNLAKFMKEYLTIEKIANTREGYVIRPNLRGGLKFEPLKGASKSLKKEYAEYWEEENDEDINKEIGL